MGLAIGICDDEQLVADNLKEIIAECLREMEQNAEISVFLSGKELLENLEPLDVVFLDVRMEEMDGYETGHQIRQRKPDCRIIMETGENESFEKAFEIGAFRYIRKPFEKVKIKEALGRIFNECRGTKTVELFLERNKYELMQREIKYIRAYNGYTEYYAGKNLFRSENSLKQIEKELDEEMFVKVHKQYIINLEYVEKKKDGTIYIDEFEVPISRRRKSRFEKAYLNYLFSK